MRLYLISVLCFQLMRTIICNFDRVPTSLREISSRNLKIGGAIAAVAGLSVGKLFIDGPTFKEDVDMKGKIVVITGGNTGLGKETALKLSNLGADVYILCKSYEKASAAVNDIIAKTGNPNVKAFPLDLADLKSVDKCASLIKSATNKIDVLVNNAGVMAIPERETTADGFEKQLGINHLGHFALTGKLLGLLKISNEPRIVNIASAAHLFAHLDFNDIMCEKAYKPWDAYGNSKLANILFTKELAKRFKKDNIISVVCHPGVCRTELGRYFFGATDNIPKYLSPVLGVALSPLVYASRSAEQGAQTQIFLSASKTLTSDDSGKYFDSLKPATPSKAAENDQNAAKLWEISEQLTGVRYS